MRIHICDFYLVSTLLLLCCPTADSRARIERFDIHVQSGFFVPDNPAIIGSQSAQYYSNGQLYGIYARGFGYGYDIFLAADCVISDWVVRVDFGRRYLHNGPDKSEKAILDSYHEGTMTIYPVMLDIIKEIEISRADVIPYAGTGIGVNIIDWSESSDYSGYGQRFYTKGTKGSIAYNFLVGSKFSVYKNLSLSLEYSYSFVPAQINIFRYYDLGGTKRANVGGGSFRIGVVCGL